MPSIKLVSVKLCPFVQQSIILLKEKRVPFEITYIDMHHKPDWFVRMSPDARVPVLVMDDERVLLESSVINEYLDELHSPPLHPHDIYTKAQHRSWIDFATRLLVDCHRLKMTSDPDSYHQKKLTLVNHLKVLETEVAGRSLFHDDTFCLVDASMAPAFRWIEAMDRLFDTQLQETAPGLDNYSKTLLSRQSVIESAVEEFEELFITLMVEGNTVLHQRWEESQKQSS